MLQPVPLLARIAAEAGEMRVCSGILLLTLLNPVEVAENAATLDAITDGRFVLGLGLGYRQEENDAFGLPARRLSIFEQKLDVVRRLLEGEAVTAEGHGFQLERAAARAAADAGAAPADLAGRQQRQGRPARRTTGGCLAAQPAHEAGTSSSASSGSTSPSACAAGCSAATEIPIIKELYVGADDDSAMRAVRPFLEDKYQAYVQWGQSEVLPPGDTLRQEFDELAEGGRFIVGAPETCARQVREHVERLGATSLPVPLPVAGDAAGARARLHAACGRGGLPAASD